MLAPLAQADDLKDKQREVKKQKTQAHHDLDESSTELRQATINLRRAQKKLDTAQAKLGETRGELSASKARDVRSEEHTSELQSLMRISYAVICLKKKKPTHY